MSDKNVLEKVEREMPETEAPREVQNLKQKKKPVPETTGSKEVPEIEESRPVQDLEVETKEVPEVEPAKEFPVMGNPENQVTIGGKTIEIKPTKLKYQRNRTGVFYRALELYPITDIFAMGPDVFGEGRDGDKALCDWLVAVTNDEQLIRENIDDIDTEMVYKLLEIYRRVNKIDEIEERQKNLRTPGAKRG